MTHTHTYIQTHTQALRFKDNIYKSDHFFHRFLCREQKMGFFLILIDRFYENPKTK